MKRQLAVLFSAACLAASCGGTSVDPVPVDLAPSRAMDQDPSISVAQISPQNLPRFEPTFNSETIQSALERCVRRFIESQDLPDLRGWRWMLVLPGGELAFFRVGYGEAHDCEAGCFHSAAYGLARGCGKIGWFTFAHYETEEISDPVMYDIESSEDDLFDQATWDALDAADTWFFQWGFLHYLAAAPNLPQPGLTRLALGLYEFIDPGLAMVMLANPAVRSDRALLEILSALPVFSGDAYEEARELARNLLEHLDE